MDYTVFDQPQRLTDGTYSMDFTYGHDDQRRMTVLKNNSVTQETWIYFGGFEEQRKADGTVNQLCYISSPDGPVALFRRTGTAAHSKYYILKDHLGSVTALITSSGKIEQEYSYDPWGRTRKPTDWTYYATGSVPANLYTNRGYTFHEMLSSFSLINANGRIYDPLVGRFISPDNNVQAFGLAQNFNRYSYGFNNPLIYSDPDGESLILVAALVGAWMGMGQAMVNSDKSGWGRAGDMLKGALIGGAAGAVGAWAGGAVAGALGNATSLGNAIFNGSVAGMAGGGAGGFVGGAGNAWMHGANLGEGLKAGIITGGIYALAGGLLGGITGGFSYHRQIEAFFKGCETLNVNPEEAVPATDKFLSDAQKVWFKDAPMDKVKAFTVEKVPNDLQIKMNAEKASGATVRLANKGLLTGKSNVYFNKNLAFSSAKKLFVTMGHEFVHVSQYAALVGKQTTLITKDFVEMMEFHAYSYSSSLQSQLGIGGSGNPFNVAALMRNSYFSRMSYLNFPWTYTSNFKYPF